MGETAPRPVARPNQPRALFPLAVFSAVLLAAVSARAACPSAGDQRVEVTAVSERGEILLADGRQARLAGLDVPDPGRGEPENAAAARNWLSSRLVGREVGLRALAPRPDRWGRLLADVFTDGPGAPPSSIAAGLLAAGLARVRPEVETRDCRTERLAAEEAARANGLGLWTDPYYGVVEATDLDELRQRDGEFAIVEGVVRRVGEGRSRIYLDFGRRGGFTAVAAARQAQAFERAGVALARLQGARIRVRGAMDNRFGLRMAITGPDQIERLAAGAGNSEVRPDK
ncbi:MAG: thermonuclease family protein [Roseiarcus sp.]